MNEITLEKINEALKVLNLPYMVKMEEGKIHSFSTHEKPSFSTPFTRDYDLSHTYNPPLEDFIIHDIMSHYVYKKNVDSLIFHPASMIYWPHGFFPLVKKFISENPHQSGFFNERSMKLFDKITTFFEELVKQDLEEGQEERDAMVSEQRKKIRENREREEKDA